MTLPTDEPEVPVSREVMAHEFRTEITRLNLETLEKYRAEAINRSSRAGELDQFWSALKSHESIDNEWLAEWELRTKSILKGEP